jgi:hypothetical protein
MQQSPNSWNRWLVDFLSAIVGDIAGSVLLVVEMQDTNFMQVHRSFLALLN